MRHTIVINYYQTTSSHGVTREFVHPSSVGVAPILKQLTGRDALDSVTRELLRDLTQGAILWNELPEPKSTPYPLNVSPEAVKFWRWATS